MDGREGMAIPGSASYYLHRGISGSGNNESSLHTPPGFRHFTNPHNAFQSSLRDRSVVPLALPIEDPSPNFPHALNIGSSSGDPVKKKRGRPRKYGPDGANMSLGLSTISPNPSQSLMVIPSPKRPRGRPKGSGRKQQLASLGEWMNNSAGLAFTPHVIRVAVGEDIATKVLSFAQQRPRALCILSADGSVSAVTFRQSASSAGSFTFEGRFEILCLSGSYLVAENGGPRDRTGGLSVSLSSSDGHVIGGGVGSLIAASPVQVMVCSFVYGGGGKTKNKTETSSPKEEGENSKTPLLLMGEKSSTPPPPLPPPSRSAPTPAPAPHQNFSLNSAMVGGWPASRSDPRHPHSDIDLTRG